MPVFALIAIRLDLGGTYSRGLFLKMWSNDVTHQESQPGTEFVTDMRSLESAMRAINDNISGDRAKQMSAAIRGKR